MKREKFTQSNAIRMKTIMIILFSIIVFGTLYYIVFVKEKKVTNDKLLKIQNQKNGILVSTTESSKYICDYDMQLVNDSTRKISIYTTSIYNLFARKVSEINITLDDKVKKIIFVGKTIERDK